MNEREETSVVIEVVNQIYDAHCMSCGCNTDSDGFSDACPECGAQMHLDIPDGEFPPYEDNLTFNDIHPAFA